MPERVMRAVVMKFGGSSVVDATAIDRVVSMVEPERTGGGTPVVVVSALGGATDRLLGLAEAARTGTSQGEIEEGVAALRRRHLDDASRLGADADGTLVAVIDRHVDELLGALEEIEQWRTADPKLLDVIAAAGELLSSRLVAAAMVARGVPAAWVDAREVIVTNDRHTCAVRLMAEPAHAAVAAIEPLVPAARIPVCGGSVGRTTGGATTTLGRGGSDYSASLAGAAIHASEIQIWTDVDGMLTADPRIVDDAEVVRHLSFAEASELAYFGAKVLHPSTIFPAVSRNIPVRILNSHRPEAEGTLITANPPQAHIDRPFAAPACERRITILDITSTRMLMAHGFLRRVFEAFEGNETAVDVVSSSAVSVSVTIDDNTRGAHIVAE